MRRALLAALMVCFTLAGVDGAQATTILITVSKPGQRMTVNVDGVDKYVWPVSTGAPGYDTPSGTYRPFRMEVDHFSQQWDNAPMPHSIFFTMIGHAIHGSFHVKTLGQAVSHGCVRISPDNATLLYGMIQKAGMKNTTVVIKGGFFDFGNQAPGYLDPLKKKKKTFSLFGTG